MIDRKFAGDQIARLIGLKFFPSARSEQVELVTMLTYSRNEVIAMAVINEWLEGSSERPAPADIRRIVASHNEAAEQREKQEAQSVPTHYGCRTCQDDGFYGGQLGGVYAGPWKWCQCFAGDEKRRCEPNLVAEANEVREILLKGFADPKKPGMRQAGAAAMDEYSGEF